MFYLKNIFLIWIFNFDPGRKVLSESRTLSDPKRTRLCKEHRDNKWRSFTRVNTPKSGLSRTFRHDLEGPKENLSSKKTTKTKHRKRHYLETSLNNRWEEFFSVVFVFETEKLKKVFYFTSFITLLFDCRRK